MTNLVLDDLGGAVAVIAIDRLFEKKVRKEEKKEAKKEKKELNAEMEDTEVENKDLEGTETSVDKPPPSEFST